MFYDIKNDSLGKFDVESEEYESMKQLNRFYENIKLRQQELKVNFREHLAVIYPNYKITDSNPNGAFKQVYSNESLGFLKEFPHPELVINKTVEEIAIAVGKPKKSVNNAIYRIKEKVKALEFPDR